MSQPWESPVYTDSELEEFQRIADVMYENVSTSCIFLILVIALWTF